MRLSTTRTIGASLLFATLLACAAHQKELNVALGGLNAARDGYVAWDLRHQEDIVAAGGDVQGNINAYRATRDKVTNGFIMAYAALTLAALEPTEGSLAEAFKCAKLLYDQIKELTSGQK